VYFSNRVIDQQNETIQKLNGREFIMAHWLTYDSNPTPNKKYNASEVKDDYITIGVLHQKKNWFL
jgi:hypothetical protein